MLCPKQKTFQKIKVELQWKNVFKNKRGKPYSIKSFIKRLCFCLLHQGKKSICICTYTSATQTMYRKTMLGAPRNN